MMNAERKIFQLAKTENIIEALRRRDFILAQLKSQKLESVLKILQSNFDPAVPNAVQDQNVIMILSDRLKQMNEQLLAQEQGFGEPTVYHVGLIPVFQQTVEERTTASPQASALSTPASPTRPIPT